MAADLGKTPDNEIIKRALPLIVNSAVDGIPKAILDDPIGDGFVDPKTSTHAWDEK